MNNDIIGKEVVFYENNTWNHIIKEINLYTYTIEYGIKSGFSDKEQAEQSYFFFNEKFQKDIERIKRLTNIQYTFTEYLDFWISKLMGHKSVATTFEIYCGIMEAKKEIAKTIDSVMDPAIGAVKVRSKGGIVCM